MNVLFIKHRHAIPIHDAYSILKLSNLSRDTTEINPDLEILELRIIIFDDP